MSSTTTLLKRIRNCPQTINVQIRYFKTGNVVFPSISYSETDLKIELDLYCLYSNPGTLSTDWLTTPPLTLNLFSPICEASQSLIRPSTRIINIFVCFALGRCRQIFSPRRICPWVVKCYVAQIHKNIKIR